MSPQFVDFNADGHLDIVAGIFDGSPHVAFGSAEGFAQPQQILDRMGNRIVMNKFWNFEAKKWDRTDRCDPGGVLPMGHLTSAWAADIDGDGDFDLLLGDHRHGLVMSRENEGSNELPAFARHNAVVRVGEGAPLQVPGTVATLRLFDWDRDGCDDLVCGSMGDAYGLKAGGAVYVYPNRGTAKQPVYGEPITLIEPSRKRANEPTRPDSGLHMDIGDLDGDGDLDLVVGGYSHWLPADGGDLQRKAFVWWYENLTRSPQGATSGSRPGR